MPIREPAGRAGTNWGTQHNGCATLGTRNNRSGTKNSRSRTSRLLWGSLRIVFGLQIEIDADANGGEHTNPDPDLARNGGQ